MSQRTGALSTSRTAPSSFAASYRSIVGSVALYTATTSSPAAAPAIASVASSLNDDTSGALAVAGGVAAAPGALGGP